MDRPASDTYLSEAAVAERWHVSTKTVRRLSQEGALRQTIIRRTPRYALSDVRAYEAAQIRGVGKARVATAEPETIEYVAPPAQRQAPVPRQRRTWYAVSIAHRKGGQGKSATTYYLALECALAGKRVICRDMDEQLTLTKFFRGTGAEFTRDGIGLASRSMAIVPPGAEPPFTPDLELIDTPPALLGSMPAIDESDALIVPAIPEPASLVALREMLTALREETAHHPYLRYLGVLPTRVITRWASHRAGLAELNAIAREFGTPVLPAVPQSRWVPELSNRGRLWRPTAEAVLRAMQEDGHA
jgi:chromosome partitioning protein